MPTATAAALFFATHEISGTAPPYIADSRPASFHATCPWVTYGMVIGEKPRTLSCSLN